MISYNQILFFCAVFILGSEAQELRVYTLSCKGLSNEDWFDVSDPYVVVYNKTNKKVYNSSHQSDTLNPTFTGVSFKWFEDEVYNFQFWDKDDHWFTGNDDFLASVKIGANDLIGTHKLTSNQKTEGDGTVIITETTVRPTSTTTSTTTEKTTTSTTAEPTTEKTTTSTTPEPTTEKTTSTTPEPTTEKTTTSTTPEPTTEKTTTSTTPEPTTEKTTSTTPELTTEKTTTSTTPEPTTEKTTTSTTPEPTTEKTTTPTTPEPTTEKTTTSTTPEPTTLRPNPRECSEDGGMIEHESICQAYYVCINGEPLDDYWMCPDGFLFDYYLQRCNLEAAVNCDKK